MIGFHSNAQTPVTIVKENNYNITGTETLIASESITLKPNAWIKPGSTFIAKIESDAYRSNQFSNENYVFTRVFQTPMNTSLEITKNSDVIETINYFDGLGRPMQNINIKASPSIKDIITTITYDSIGRQKMEFLPYMDTSINLASYRNAAIANTNNYYKSNYPADINNSKPNPFSQKDFEHSPLSRIMKQAFPGSDWALGNGHEIKFDYQTNQENEVKQFLIRSKIGSETIDSKIYSSSYYVVGLLNKKIVKNENWVTADGDNNTTHEFIDKEGNIVLKRIFGESKVNGTLANVNHDTYYLYDEYGNLTYVIPPLANTDALIKTEQSVGGFEDFNKIFNQSVFSGTTSGSGSVTVTIVNNVLKVAFSGGYNSSFLSNNPQDLLTSPCTLPDINLGTISNGDYNASIVNGKLKLTSITGVPSTSFSATFTVILPTNCSGYRTEPDSIILNNLCYQYKYDTKNRLIEKRLPGKDVEYLVYDKLDRLLLTQDANLRASNKWLFTKYDVFNRSVYTGEYINTTNTTRATIQALADKSGTVSENKQTAILNINGTNLNYSNNVFPNLGIDLFVINYYDDYKYIDLDGGDAVSSYSITSITNPKGLNTCSKVRILDTNNWITSVSYYDSKGRSVYNYNNNNYLAVTSTVKTQLDFAGKILETTNSHKKGDDALITITDSYSYDHAGRLLTQKQTINNQAQELIVSNNYSNLGQLTAKGVGGKTTQPRLQNIDYTYNIRGWLKGINNINAIGNNLFAFQLNYNDINNISTPLFNGNISQTFWKTTNYDSSLKNYAYGYDQLDRLIYAVGESNDQEEMASYDKNGNIMSMYRTGIRPKNTGTSKRVMSIFDDLIYTYDAGNKIIKVEDNADPNEGFKNGANLPVEYTYDDNGNMKTDANKGITNIVYNNLNLPTLITLPGGTISYTYDAAGIKQRKIAGNITTDYANGFQYENNILQFFPQPEGYVSNNNGVYEYIYQYKDHLGNIRLSYNKDLTIVEENNYYPFGLKHQGYNTAVTSTNPASKYKYNGKELQDEMGLNMYDYGARNYDPALGRWMNIDPLAEKSRRFSPYTYALNNPVYFIDPDGMIAIPSPLEAAIMSKHVYGDKVKLIGGWKVSSVGRGLTLSNNDTGFKSQVYERTVKGKTEYTYATAGTEDMKDTKQDVKQIFGMAEQYKQSTDNAKELDASLKGAELTFTGHSLGGGLAEANAIATGDNAVTFNAAGLSVFSPGGLQKSTTTDAYIVITDPLNALQGATGLPTAGGTKHYIDPGSTQGVANGHSIDSAIEGLRTQSFGGFVKNSVSNWWNKYK
ncbi:DUF6443 domain-containing protein [Flavobacterium sp. N1736]|uniref:DUF6443 domain-containing protein n=1 Tax=Flavobacterium sp. N1736 TaxID=2986823 RepID=UPI002224A065|nr:DUF6443 domain-containing protein [Flavobacterium sp. N1736]